ncbi:hypothetical protein VTJ04DRAFT_5938 [Mycothermus thermophilus]|uniref:uncharacterized protein n=1 Tax=Humicola insolens TaxID=85995 RepID=UPI003742AE4F
MEYMMHQPEAPAGQAPCPGSFLSGLPQQRHSCPYFSTFGQPQTGQYHHRTFLNEGSTLPSPSFSLPPVSGPNPTPASAPAPAPAPVSFHHFGPTDQQSRQQQQSSQQLPHLPQISQLSQLSQFPTQLPHLSSQLSHLDSTFRSFQGPAPSPLSSITSSSGNRGMNGSYPSVGTLDNQQGQQQQQQQEHQDSRRQQQEQQQEQQVDRQGSGPPLTQRDSGPTQTSGQQHTQPQTPQTQDPSGSSSSSHSHHSPPSQSHNSSPSHFHSSSPQHLPTLQPSTLPYPQPYLSSHLHHPSYDPLHSSGPSWFSGSTTGPGSLWSPPPLHLYSPTTTRTSTTSSSTTSSSLTGQTSQPRPTPADSQLGGVSVQPGHSASPNFSPNHDRLPPALYSYNRAPHSLRNSIVLPAPSHLSTQPAASAPVSAATTQRQGPSDDSQPSPSTQSGQDAAPVTSNPSPAVTSMSDNRNPPPPTAGAGRGFPLSDGTGNNANTSQQPSGTSQPPISQYVPASHLRNPSLLTQPVSFDPPITFGLPGQSNTASGDGPSSSGTQQGPSAATTPSRQPDHIQVRVRETPARRAQPGAPASTASQQPIPPAPASHRRGMVFTRRAQGDDSDEDGGFTSNEDDQMMRYEDEFGAMPAQLRAMFAEDHVRAAQVLRGQLSGTKRVASKQALAQLQSVDPSTLPEGERTCVICYNDFGQKSPEGVIEAPLRLPKCKHVFGDHCLKKWFEESDSCPYCRDKVPSEPAMGPAFRAFQNYYRRHHRAIGSSSSSAAASSEESMLRAIAEQQREFTRYRIRQEVASIARSRERRSPPSEPENHRRTRPRHASFAPTSYISPPNPPRAPAATAQSPPGPGLSMNSSLRQRMGGQGPGPFNGRFLPPTQLPPLNPAPMQGMDLPGMFTYGAPPQAPTPNFAYGPYPQNSNPNPYQPALSFNPSSMPRYSFPPAPNFGHPNPSSGFMDPGNGGSGDSNTSSGTDRPMQ